jgi:hypothetical protein
MKTLFVRAGMWACMLMASSGVVWGQTPGPIPVAAQQALVDQYCSGCHNDLESEGGFSWTSIDLANPDHNATQAEEVIRKLRAGMMPPAGQPRPEPSSLNELASAIATAIDSAAAEEPFAGAPELHRLNRTEYRNSVRELLDLDVDVSAMLPPDQMSGGFDNISDVLAVTPALVQGYVRAAGKISRLAVGDAEVAPTMSMYTVPKVVNQLRHVEGTPLGTRGGTSVIYNFPADGEYTFKITFYHDFITELFGANLPENLQGQEIEISIDGARVAIFEIDPELPEPEGLLTTESVRVTAGAHRVAAAFISKFDGPTEDQFRQVEQSMIDVTAAVPGLVALPHLHTLTIAGPFVVTGLSETASRQRIFTCRPTSSDEELECARNILGTLARRAYRRPISNADVDYLVNHYNSGREEGDFEAGIQLGVQAILGHPEFVFRFEKTPGDVRPGENYQVGEMELASRLAFFLWSSLPDEELLSLASDGRLNDPGMLEQQVRRMLADSRSVALTDNFAFQWLRLQTVKEAHPESLVFPEFTRNLGESMAEETKRLFDHIKREDRSVLELLTADYTFVDEVLAKHYGIPNVLGSRFRRVQVTDPNRIGLLGHGSILTLTSLANRTSPVQRGKYVMEVLIGSPPPAPPPAVPPLKEAVDNQKVLSVRDRMIQHRQNPVCAACHQMMDPIGLTLENFDAIGRWRTRDSGYVVDPSATMYDGTLLDGPASLRQAVLNRSDAFIGTFTEHLLSYGLGRVLDSRDMPTVRSIAREATSNDNRISSFILGVVQSVPFRTRRADDLETADQLRNR